MGSSDNFLEEFRNYLSTIDEEYLIAVSNKGILNRAKKELEAGEKVSITIKEGSIEASLEDGTICNINTDIKNFKCSCPSRNICKHVVKGYLYLKAHSKEIFLMEEEKEQIKLDFSELLKLDIKGIKKYLSSREIKNIINKIQFGFSPEIQEDSILKISFVEDNLAVKFVKAKAVEEDGVLELKNSSILNSGVCSCKEKAICKHKIEALICYMLHKQVISLQDLERLAQEELDIDKEDLRSTLEGIKRLLTEIYIGGLARISFNVCEQLQQMSLIAHNNSMPNLEKRLRAIAVNLEKYINKNAGFSLTNLRRQMQYVYRIINALENSQDKKLISNLAGKYKTNYYDIPSIELQGLGARWWITSSGYEGITYYFYNDSFDKLFTYTESRANYYEDVRTYNTYKQEAPWGIKAKKGEFSKSHLLLRKGKVNEAFRLSASTESLGEILEKTQINTIQSKNYVFEDWEELFNKLQTSILEADFDDKEENIFLLKIASFEKSSFDHLQQVFSMGIRDFKGRRIFIKIRFSDSNKSLIENLEADEKNNRFPYMLMCEVYIFQGEVIAMPITAYYQNHKCTNLTLE